MTIFKKIRAGNQQPTKLQKRIAGISTHELVVWAENSLFVIGKNIVHHQRDGLDAIAEAEIGAEALLAITQELKKRLQNGS
jgi:hypothetical protein